MTNFHEKQKKMREQMAKRAISDAAVHVVSSKGYDHLTMHDVAEKAGIATGTIYNYFKNKEDLFFYVHEYVYQAIQDQLDSVSKKQNDPAERIANFFDEVFTLCDKYKTVFAITKKLGIKERTPMEQKKAHIAHHISVTQRIIEEGIKLNKFRKVDTAQTAEMFLFALIGFVEIQNNLDEGHFHQRAESMKSFFLNYLLRKED